MAVSTCPYNLSLDYHSRIVEHHAVEQDFGVLRLSQCFVLGAGFSKECGLPLARELTPLVFEQAYGSAEGAGAEVGKSYLEFMRHLYPALDFSSEWPDFEELITVLAESSEWQNRYEGRDCSGDVPTAGHLKRTMLKELEILIC